MRARILFAGILGLVILTIVPAAAQITITASDVTSTFGVGKVLYQYTDTTATSLNVGSPGATSWDFSNLRIDIGSTLTSVTPASTPFSADFPGATHALQTPQSFFGYTLTVYQYFTLGTNLLNPGTKGSGTTPFGEAVYSLMNSPAQVYFGLPSTYQTTWNTSFTETELITAGVITIGPTITNYTEQYTVDAYGPLTVKGGTVYQALRVRYKEYSPGLSVGYIFLSKEGLIITVSSLDTTATSGVVPIDGVTWISPVAVGVPADQPTPVEFALNQNYPNPFNPATEISYQVPSVTRVKLAVFDLLGREVAVLVDGVKEPGSYTAHFDAQGLASGVYLYRLEAGSFVQAKKMVILR